MSFYVTTPIYYPNGSPHLGTAYTTLYADFLARYHRMLGEQVFLLTGTDENSQKIVREAEKQGIDPYTLLDTNVEQFKDLFNDLSISYDAFIRTTDTKLHHPAAQKLWMKLVEAGDIYKKKYTGLYCVGSESFVTEKDLRPNGMCPLHDELPITVEEENYFFKLSKYQQFLIDAISSDTLRVYPESRKNEVLSFLKEPLEDISFSRAIKEGNTGFGVPVPHDDSQVMYVWCDALTNYISALGYGTSDTSLMQEFWPASLHIIGKDILRFHAIFWPAMLHAAGLELPKALYAHGMITSGGRKMSKSLGNVIDPLELIREYGPEAIRFFVARELPPAEDPEMTLDMVKNAYNAHLANGLGNLVNRIMRMAISYGVEYGDFSDKKVTDVDGFDRYARAFENFDVPAAAQFITEKATSMDRYIQETEPFKMVKVEPERAHEIIAYLVRQLYDVALLLEPIMPSTARTIRSLVLNKTMPEQALFARKE